jgi:hypothetical protein
MMPTPEAAKAKLLIAPRRRTAVLIKDTGGLYRTAEKVGERSAAEGLQEFQPISERIVDIAMPKSRQIVVGFHRNPGVRARLDKRVEIRDQ